MKKTIKLIGAIALVALFAFAMSCKEDGTGGATLSVSSPVEFDDIIPANVTDFSFVCIDDNNRIVPLSSIMDGDASVKIVGGKVDIKLGTPKSSAIENFMERFGKFWGTDVQVNPSNAKFYGTEDFCTSDGQYWLAFGYNDEEAALMYADRDATIKGSETYDDDSTLLYDVTLKQGWNYLFGTQTNADTWTWTASVTPPSGLTLVAVKW